MYLSACLIGRGGGGGGVAIVGGWSPKSETLCATTTHFSTKKVLGELMIPFTFKNISYNMISGIRS